MAKEQKEKVAVAESADEVKRTKLRSPNYPIISLKKAMPKVVGLYQEFKRNWIPVAIVHQRWEYKPHSGAGNQVIAALKAFGLLEVQADGKDRQVRVSERAFQIVQNHQDQPELLKKAALSPAIHAELWTKYRSEGVPPDDVVRHYLVFERNFNPETVGGFIAQFRDTISFAKLDSSDKLDPGDSATDDKISVAIGDLVQWESQGSLRFAAPKPVMDISSDGQFVFIDGELTGFPVADIRLIEKAKAGPQMVTPTPATSTTPPPPLNPNYKPGTLTGAKQYVLTTDTGNVTVQWPSELSEEDYETVEGWLDGLKKKIKRSVKGAEGEPQA